MNELLGFVQTAAWRVTVPAAFATIGGNVRANQTAAVCLPAAQ